MHPVINALLASLYISGVAFFFFNAEKYLGRTEDTVLAPITLLSLLVLSVSVMAYLFFYNPAKLFLSGRQEEALTYFFTTLGTFAAITLGLLIILFSSAF